MYLQTLLRMESIMPQGMISILRCCRLAMDETPGSLFPLSQGDI